MPDILILSGPPGAGKSTVAVALAERYDRVAHVQVDVLRHFVTPTGFVPSTRQGEARDRQYRLARRNACCLARNFLAERFGVIIEDVLWPESPSFYVEELRGCDTPIHLVQILPSLASCQEREAARRRGNTTAAWVKRDYEEYLRTASGLPGPTIDSTGLSADETADRVQALTTGGASLVWAPPR